MKQTKANTINFLGIILIACSMLILINFYTIKTLSAARAYVSGESQYSKAHNIATQNLISYLFLPQKYYWIKFEENIHICLSSIKTRHALNSNLDTEIIKESLRKGKNGENDLEDIIWLYTNFKNLPFFKKTISEWKAADIANKKLHDIAFDLKKKIEKNQLDFDTKVKMLATLDGISKEIAFRENNFSKLLSTGTHTLKYYLLATNIVFICIIIISITFYYNEIVLKMIFSKQELHQQKQQLEAIIKDLEKTKLNLKTEIVQHKKIIGTISHDIRSPLKYIQLIAKHLSSSTKKAKDPVSYKYADSIYKSSSQLYDFTKTLVEYSKIYIEERDYKQKTYSVYDLTEDKKVFFEEIAANNNTIITNKTDLNLKSNLNIRIISIIIHNLLDNAVKNTQSGNIEIGATSDSEKITYWVKDSGSGMSEHTIDYYTNLFKKRDPEKLILSTYGIGLHLVLELLILIKGTIAFSNPNNEGTTVTIEINLKNNKLLT